VLRKQSDLLLGILVALLLLGQAVFGFLPLILQEILAVAFILIVPGNALMGAIFPTASLTKLERVLYTIGLSLAVVIISGLILNTTQWGLQTKSWLIILAVISLVASVIAIFRRWQIPADETKPGSFYLPLDQVFILAMAVIVIGFSITLAISPKPADNIQGYTSLWISPPPDNQPGTLLVGVHSQELKTTQYRLQVSFNGQLIQEWTNLSLAPGNQWEQSITVPAGQGTVEAVLYRADKPGAVYRHVSTTVNQ
jgi:uncharacterized membrane protein